MSALLSAHTGFRTPEERAAFDDGVAAQLARLGIDRSRDERSESGGDVDARLARSRARARLNRRWALKESASSREDYNDFPRTERYTTTTSCGLSRDVASRACSCCQLENLLSEDELARYHRSTTSAGHDGLIPCLPCRTGAHAYVRRRLPFPVEMADRGVSGLAHREGTGRPGSLGNNPQLRGRSAAESRPPQQASEYT